MHGLVHRSSSLNTQRLDHFYTDPAMRRATASTTTVAISGRLVGLTKRLPSHPSRSHLTGTYLEEMIDPNEYSYNDYDREPDPPHQPLYLAKVLRLLEREGARTVLDAGCGDGNFAESIAQAGYEVYGLDLSETGIAVARSRGIGTFSRSSVYEDLATPFDDVDAYDVILSVEVIEHLYAPREFARRAADALRPGGLLVVTTPYWGYWKSIALALMGRIDRLHTVLWDGGHIKHWSRKTLTALMIEQDLEPVDFQGTGRSVPYLWQGMLMTFRRAEK